jgi:3'-phosphoadenosine 5'-phosphosulfate (PAPS) 3'-phosphatase
VLEEMETVARRAGLEIMKVYDATGRADNALVESKADGSPLTEADRRSHEVISRGLARIRPEIPVLSEEGREIPYSVRRDWDRLWVVDPLDGTKEFVRPWESCTLRLRTSCTPPRLTSAPPSASGAKWLVSYVCARRLLDGDSL